MSKLEAIVTNLEEHLDSSFWQGKGNRVSFKKAIKKLVSEGKLKKDEYSYIQKNERRVLTKAKLIHIIPEIQSKEVLENTLKNLSRVIIQKKTSSMEYRKDDVKTDLLSSIEHHMKQIFEPKFETVLDEFNNLISLIKNSIDVTLELEKISNYLTNIRDTLLEKGYSRMLIYDIDRLATQISKLAKRSNPGEMPSREEMIDHIAQLKYRYEHHK